jgi:hypothetical protein
MLSNPNHILLVGNGPNYFSGQFSWKDAVRATAKGLRLSNQTEQLIGEPLPLVYETLTSRYPKEEHSSKHELAKQMLGLKPNEVHAELMGLGWRTVLTTNYDYNLETVSGEHFRASNLASESTYSLFRRRSSSKCSVWHIHGELTGPRTMMLGLHQYAGYLQKLRQYLTTKANGSPFVFGGDEDWEKEGRRHSWADLFLRDHVHIVGFGFDYAEIALWWLLSYKQRLKSFKKSNLSVGTTTFYQMGNLRADRRLQMMEALGVNVRVVSLKARFPTKTNWREITRQLVAAIR